MDFVSNPEARCHEYKARRNECYIQLIGPQAINKLQYAIHGAAEASTFLEPNQLQRHIMHQDNNQKTGATNLRYTSYSQ